MKKLKEQLHKNCPAYGGGKKLLIGGSKPFETHHTKIDVEDKDHNCRTYEVNMRHTKSVNFQELLKQNSTPSETYKAARILEIIFSQNPRDKFVLKLSLSIMH